MTKPKLFESRKFVGMLSMRMDRPLVSGFLTWSHRADFNGEKSPNKETIPRPLEIRGFYDLDRMMFAVFSPDLVGNDCGRHLEILRVAREKGEVDVFWSYDISCKECVIIQNLINISDDVQRDIAEAREDKKCLSNWFLWLC